jgi:endonuclease/exonuclease/phosphatase family metal-dependent hydrolase
VTLDIDLLTMNLWGLPWPVAHRRRERKLRFFGHLLEAAYDIVGIQELWWPWRNVLPVEHFHIPRSTRDSGLALIGRLKARAEVQVEHYRHRRGIDRLKRKGLLTAIVEPHPDVELAVCVTHLQASRRNADVRACQVDQLLERLHREDRPTVVMGDFNFFADQTEDRHSAKRIAEAGFVDAAETTGSRYATYSSNNPFVRGGYRGHSAERFDRIFLRDAAGYRFEPLELQVAHGLAQPFSDHHPVHVRAQLRD